ncbi:CHAT domain-containing protein [Streptomyces mirabilis]|uniref:CHAT domain-containing protein n=1 Tax=Streptomyces mirabilis TaxID=68239 RepID=UPI00399D6D0D
MIYDVERLPQVPHTLVLAACDSGRPVVHTGDELMGLGMAFLARGAAQLIASVLPIPDAATTPVMSAFHEGLAARPPPPSPTHSRHWAAATPGPSQRQRVSSVSAREPSPLFSRRHVQWPRPSAAGGADKRGRPGITSGWSGPAG